MVVGKNCLYLQIIEETIKLSDLTFNTHKENINIL